MLKLLRTTVAEWKRVWRLLGIKKSLLYPLSKVVVPADFLPNKQEIYFLNLLRGCRIESRQVLKEHYLTSIIIYPASIYTHRVSQTKCTMLTVNRSCSLLKSMSRPWHLATVGSQVHLWCPRLIIDNWHDRQTPADKTQYTWHRFADNWSFWPDSRRSSRKIPGCGNLPEDILTGYLTS